MADKHENNNPIDPTLMDTQRLLLGVELPEDMPFDLEDILAEFGGGQELSPEDPPEPAPPASRCATPRGS